jgi:hypothetical protein
MPAGDASLTTAQVNQKNALTAITVSTAISEMSAQTTPLESLHRFPRIQPISGHRDYSRLAARMVERQMLTRAAVNR